MNKRYIDFVPTKNTGTPVKRKQSTGVRVSMPKAAAGAKPRVATRATTPRTAPRVVAPRVVTRKPASREAPEVVRVAGTKASASGASRGSVAKANTVVANEKMAISKTIEPGSKMPVLGVVEDLNTKFVRTDVPKRPLSQNPQAETAKNELTKAKAEKVKSRRILRSAAKPVEKPVENSTKTEAKSVYKAPKSPFINQEKVVKRPLSKNVYQKKIETPKEEPKGPVTIITKPEKDSHIGIVVTIIITIILGATAGTVAFLLLPK